MKPEFGMYDFFLVVTNRSSGGPKHLIADVYANRKRYKAVFANGPGIDTIREALADIVNRSSRLTSLALAPESE